MADFFINISEDSFYPSPQNNYNPDVLFPEYRWANSDISKEKNHVYDMVRNCLIGLKMDVSNFNTKDWNPFGDLIKQDDIVVIKPNWVMHYNKNRSLSSDGLECLITHPSVVRAVIDYCLIALKGSGKIIVGDAPMQGCDLDYLVEMSGYKELFSFYNTHSINIEPTDFREYSTLVDNNKVLKGRRYNSGKALTIELNSRSRLNHESINKKIYTVTDYSEKTTNKFHQTGKHTYLINQEVLSADVVINLCKPKCHRLAGITGAIKNTVGITHNKACLPHRTIGAKNQGGDEYLYNSVIKKIIRKVLAQKLNFEERERVKLSLAMRYLYGFLYYLMRIVCKDPFLLGSWYGNDTIWRTSLDLYEILLYSDKGGTMKKIRQRKIFNIADMIISGERNGPISPEPKKLGILIAGHDAVMMDRLICEIMGFDYKKVPSILESVNDLMLIQKSTFDYIIYSNLPAYNEKCIDELRFPPKWKFKPYDTWKGFIEKV